MCMHVCVCVHVCVCLMTKMLTVLDFQLREDEEELQRLMTVQDLMMDDDEEAFAVSTMTMMVMTARVELN